MATKSTPKSPDAIISLRLPREMHERLKAMASREYRTLNAEINRALAAYVEADDESKAAA